MVITCAIAFSLWRAGRDISTISVRRNNYVGPISTILESGAIFVIAITVIFAINITRNPAGFVGIFAIAQVVVSYWIPGSMIIICYELIQSLCQTISPLLMIVRVGLGLTHGSARPSEFAARGIEIIVSREEVRDVALNSSGAQFMAPDGKDKAFNV